MYEAFFKSTITNMATVRIVQVMFDKFNADKMCISNKFFPEKENIITAAYYYYYYYYYYLQMKAIGNSRLIITRSSDYICMIPARWTFRHLVFYSRLITYIT
jgi:hypothetical protein